MRLATIETAAGPRAALLHEDTYIDLFATDPGLPGSVRQLLLEGPAVLEAAKRVVGHPHAIRQPADSVRVLPPVPDPAKIVCIGLNYRDHAEESGAAIPKEPVLFSKYATALVGPGAPIVLP